jgi:predicted ATPase/DNA-binding CsgD family transcriptional regulator
MARPLRRPGNLPAEATSFIGRRRELAELRKQLAAARLVTLVGPGGVGKTRLAIRSGTDLARAFPGGAWLVELADLRDPELVSNAVLAALDLRDQTATGPRAVLLSYLRDKELLLLVDNCEHLLDAAATLVSDVLRTAPHVKVITTSREPLSVAGEHVLPVPPLELPGLQGGESLEQLRLNESVELFVERASAATGGFELTDANRAAVVDVCRRLDGLPLAIELAAVRTRVLSPEEILDRLTNRFSLLTGGSRAALPRHQTLRTAVEWSHDLLTPDEQRLLRRLCVFAGRFNLTDVEAVCAVGVEPAGGSLDVLSSLVGKSLVVRDEAPGPATFRLHETMREFALDRTRAAGEEAVVGERFIDHYVSMCGRASADARFDLVAWLAWMDLEIDNVRSVLRRCVDHGDTARGMDLAVSLRWFWATRATTEGARWLEELLAVGTDDGDRQAEAQYLRGFLAVLLVDPVSAGPFLEGAAMMWRTAGRPAALAVTLAMASMAANMAGDQASARHRLDEAKDVATGLDDVPVTLTLLQAEALDGLFAGDLSAAVIASTRGLRLSRELGDLYTLKVWLLNLGTAALAVGDFGRAKPLVSEALEVAARVDDRVQQAYLLAATGCLAAADAPDLAARLLGAGETMRTGAGARVMPFLVPLAARAEATAVAALGRSRFEAARGVGAGLSRDEAVRLALGGSLTVVSPPRRGAGPLSAREEEVARLVADGLTNKEIGARLFISEHTVDTHVRGIMNKLGFDSRARIAAWVASTSE